MNPEQEKKAEVSALSHCDCSPIHHEQLLSEISSVELLLSKAVVQFCHLKVSLRLAEFCNFLDVKGLQKCKAFIINVST